MVAGVALKTLGPSGWQARRARSNAPYLAGRYRRLAIGHGPPYGVLRAYTPI